MPTIKKDIAANDPVYELEGDLVRVEIDPENWPKLTAEQRARLAALPTDDGGIDYSDIPDDSDELEWHRPARFVPPRPNKIQLSVRYDADVVAWFKRHGRKYQTMMNQVLRTYMEARRGDS